MAPGVDPVETLLAAARLGEAAERQAALRRLSRRLQDPRVIAFRHALEKKAIGSDITVAWGALRALAELRDKDAVPAIAELVEAGDPEVAKAAHAALVQLTCDTMARMQREPVDRSPQLALTVDGLQSLLEALAHRNPELRLQASSELYEISGEYFGYHYDLPERDREEARQRWIAWWQGQHKHE